MRFWFSKHIITVQRCVMYFNNHKLRTRKLYRQVPTRCTCNFLVLITIFNAQAMASWHSKFNTHFKYTFYVTIFFLWSKIIYCFLFVYANLIVFESFNIIRIVYLYFTLVEQLNIELDRKIPANVHRRLWEEWWDLMSSKVNSPWYTHCIRTIHTYHTYVIYISIFICKNIRLKLCAYAIRMWFLICRDTGKTTREKKKWWNLLKRNLKASVSRVWRKRVAGV